MKRTPIKRRSSKESARVRRYNKQRVQLLEEGTACGARTPNCRGVADQLHHRKGRDGDLVDNPDYLLPCCWACHQYIHGHPAESYERGWMVRRNGSV